VRYPDGNIDERFEALQVLAKRDGDNIRALVRIAEIHEGRLTAPEDDDQ
jgi:hypothetical protein